MTRRRHPKRSAYHGPPRTIPARIPEPLKSLLREWTRQGVTPETLTDEHRELAHMALALATD